MATDAVIQFHLSDSTHVISVYKRYDSFIPSLGKFLRKKTDEFDTRDKQKGKVDPGFLFAHLIYELYSEADNPFGIKIIPQVRESDKSFCTKWVLTLDKDRYANPEKSYPESIFLLISNPFNDKIYYRGYLDKFSFDDN